jgi:hypothetical protein
MKWHAVARSEIPRQGGVGGAEVGDAHSSDPEGVPSVNAMVCGIQSGHVWAYEEGAAMNYHVRIRFTGPRYAGNEDWVGIGWIWANVEGWKRVGR